MDKFELQKLRELPIEGVAERLGMRVERHKCLCPFHEDSHPSLSFCVRRNTYRCFVCGASGGTIDLVMRYLNKDFKEACNWLSGNASLPLTAYSLPEEGEVSFDASRYEKFFERPFLSEAARRFLFEERRLDPRVVRWCRLTSWRDKQGVDWLQIPYYSKEGKLVGIQNRNLSVSKVQGVQGVQVPRFRFPCGSKCGIYNLPILNLLKPNEELYITEGSSDCWAMLSSGHKAIAIPSATLLTKEDINQLSILNSQLSIQYHMYPDRDEPGERLFLQLQRFLPSLVHHQLPANCKDYGELYVRVKG